MDDSALPVLHRRDEVFDLGTVLGHPSIITYSYREKKADYTQYAEVYIKKKMITIGMLYTGCLKDRKGVLLCTWNEWLLKCGLLDKKRNKEARKAALELLNGRVKALSTFWRKRGYVAAGEKLFCGLCYKDDIPREDTNIRWQLFMIKDAFKDAFDGGFPTVCRLNLVLGLELTFIGPRCDYMYETPAILTSDKLVYYDRHF